MTGASSSNIASGRISPCLRSLAIFDRASLACWRHSRASHAYAYWGGRSLKAGLPYVLRSLGRPCLGLGGL